MTHPAPLGKLAVVTGATKGIGRAIAEQFAAEGFDLAFCARTAADVQAMETDLSRRFPHQRFLGRAADLSSATAVDSFARAVVEQGRAADVLVNNAGVFLPCPVADPAGREAFDLMMRTNISSAYWLTQSLLPPMRAARRGHIFNICSIASVIPYGGGYGVSKFALFGYSKNLREELKKDGVRVTAVLPGATLTPSWDGVDLPADRFVRASDVADAVWACYALSPQAVVEELLVRPQLGDIVL